MDPHARGEAVRFGFPKFGPDRRTSSSQGRDRAQCPDPNRHRSGLYRRFLRGDRNLRPGRPRQKCGETRPGGESFCLSPAGATGVRRPPCIARYLRGRESPSPLGQPGKMTPVPAEPPSAMGCGIAGVSPKKKNRGGMGHGARGGVSAAQGPPRQPAEGTGARGGWGRAAPNGPTYRPRVTPPIDAKPTERWAP